MFYNAFTLGKHLQLDCFGLFETIFTILKLYLFQFAWKFKGWIIVYQNCWELYFYFLISNFLLKQFWKGVKFVLDLIDWPNIVVFLNLNNQTGISLYLWLKTIFIQIRDWIWDWISWDTKVIFFMRLKEWLWDWKQFFSGDRILISWLSHFFMRSKVPHNGF